MRELTLFRLGSCLLLLAGCTQRLPGTGTMSTISSGSIEVQDSHVFYHSVDGVPQLLVWKGCRESDVMEADIGTDGEWLRLKDDRTLEWKRKHDSDIITVENQDYSLRDGRLLLLSFQADDVRVQQLDLDLSRLGSNREDLQESLINLAETDQTVRDFLDSIRADRN